MAKPITFRFLACLLLIGLSCARADSQGGCTPYKPFNIGGFAGWPDEGPGGAPGWQANVDQLVATYGGVGPFCEYTWFPNDGYGGHWYGSCWTILYNCSQTPVPPPGSAGEGGVGPPPSCPSSGGPGGGNAPSCGSPINVATGNTYIQEMDLAIPGLGGGLNLTRTWNSLWPASQSSQSVGLFGNNWRSTYEERIFMGNDGTIKYGRADGKFWSIIPYGNPVTYHVIAPANVQVTLTQQGVTTWTVIFQNGEQRIFNYNTGLLSTIIDRNGNQTMLAYDSANRLISVTDPASRHLYFNYANGSSFLVTSVTSDVGVSLSYSYDTNGLLVQVTRPDLTTVSFAYNAQSEITAVTDNNGKILETHTYDSNGRGVTSSEANGVNSLAVSY